MLKLQNTSPREPYTPLSDAQDNHLPTLVLEGFLRREELAKQLGISPRTIDRWQALREGPPRVHVGRTILYSIHSVSEWLRSREQPSPPTKTRRSFPDRQPKRN
jgi:predicted DNA-binding transcriptional regulator AlpA